MVHCQKTMDGEYSLLRYQNCLNLQQEHHQDQDPMYWLQIDQLWEMESVQTSLLFSDHNTTYFPFHLWVQHDLEIFRLVEMGSKKNTGVGPSCQNKRWILVLH